MTNHYKKMLSQLSREQLIYLIEQLTRSQFSIGETCVAASKCHIELTDAIRNIRDDIYDLPSAYNVRDLKAHIDMKMGKISVSEYRKIVGLED